MSEGRRDAPKLAILEAQRTQHAPRRSTMRPPEALLPRNPTWETSHFSGLTNLNMTASALPGKRLGHHLMRCGPAVRAARRLPSGRQVSRSLCDCDCDFLTRGKISCSSFFAPKASHPPKILEMLELDGKSQATVILCAVS